MTRVTSNDPRHCPRTRPTEPRAEAPAKPIAARFSPEERARIESAKRVTRQTFSEFIRDAALDRADAALEDSDD